MRRGLAQVNGRACGRAYLLSTGSPRNGCGRTAASWCFRPSTPTPFTGPRRSARRRLTDKSDLVAAVGPNQAVAVGPNRVDIPKPLSPADRALYRAVLAGGDAITGFRNADLMARP